MTSWPQDTDRDFILYALDCAAIVAITDVRGTITFVNQKFCEISGFSSVELIGANHRLLKSGTHDLTFFKKMYRTIAKGHVWHGEICNRRKDNSLYWVNTTIVPQRNKEGKVDRYVSIRFDITERKAAEKAILEKKKHLRNVIERDALTGLFSRSAIGKHLDYLASRQSENTRIALFLFDIDYFKAINDHLGYDFGDYVLSVIGKRLNTFSSQNIAIGRLGGDEFCLVLDDIPDRDLSTLVDAILEQVRQPILHGEEELHCTCSIGIASSSGKTVRSDDLRKEADLALHEAKRLGRDRAELFHQAMKRDFERKYFVLASAERGLKNQEFSIHFQPQIPTSDLVAPGLEALLRWNHPQKGLLTAVDFSEAFEAPRFAASVGRFVLEEAVEAASFLRLRNVPFSRIALNVSSADFHDDAFIDRFFELLEQTRLTADMFGIEVTEGMFLGRGAERTMTALNRLHEAGAEIALDDFGTGYASLSQMRYLPFDRIKIDKSFITSLETSAEDQAIVQGTVGIAIALDKAVTAEGVENFHQADFLREIGCELLQGWYFGKAQPIETIAQTLKTSRAFAGQQDMPARNSLSSELRIKRGRP
ncbi:EAL domain-containing protein [uncultured Roseibium sp.]|uniref:putative bifunctional diguanylate cyclase/phosphodiesterase n=1 Tax=uncultured Roseibium sp. TaxID=1936171 RepID=UPI0032167EC4